MIDYWNQFAQVQEYDGKLDAIAYLTAAPIPGNPSSKVWTLELDILDVVPTLLEHEVSDAILKCVQSFASPDRVLDLTNIERTTNAIRNDIIVRSRRGPPNVLVGNYWYYRDDYKGDSPFFVYKKGDKHIVVRHPKWINYGFRVPGEVAAYVRDNYSDTKCYNCI